MNKWLRWVLLIFFCAVFLVSGFMLIRYYYDSHKQAAAFDGLASMVQQAKQDAPAHTDPVQTAPPGSEPAEPTEPQPLPEYAEVSALNPDMAGWLTVDGTKINYPVMYAPGQKDKYLHLDFYGQYSGHGCLYAQEESSLDPPSDNITIYGHNMKDGSMFAGLLNYDSRSFWEDHRFITFDTLMEHRTYEIFAVFRTTASEGMGFPYYQFINAQTPEDFASYISQCKALAVYNTGIVPEYGDKLITLSTCEYSQPNGRFVVAAKQIQ